MGHAHSLDVESLAREVRDGAASWQIRDYPGAVNRLRAAFEVLTQARERFYPVDAYFVDLCLLDPTIGSGALAGLLDTPVAISLVGPAQAIENLASRDPERMTALRQAIADGWADVAGGTYSEAEDPLLPLESILWQFRHGSSVYRSQLDDRNVETYARRRFGLHAQLPQIAKRFGFRFALHVGFDAGRFPIPSETKRLWESPDGSSLESLMRPPIAADRPAQGLHLPWRLAATMKDDHVAVVPMVHWPSPVALWYRDVRRVATYSPVLGRWSTLNDFFHLTDRPYETFRPEIDRYVSPYLAQAVAAGDEQPASRIARHHRLRARLEAAVTARALASAIEAAASEAATGPSAAESASSDPLDEVEGLIETGQYQEAEASLHETVAIEAEALASRLVTASRGATSSAKAGAVADLVSSNGQARPGFLVINALGLPRRAAVLLPEAALDLKPEGPLRAAQFTDRGVYGVVELPPFGFAWVPSEADPARPAVSRAGISAQAHQIRNEIMEVEIDSGTGGIRRLSAAGETTARLGQQLVMTGFQSAGEKQPASQMRADRVEIDYAGPALAQATSFGGLFHPREGRRLATFVQHYRLWTGRPILEIDVTLSDIDPAWLNRAGHADGYATYLACRWAWPDASSMVRRLVFSYPEITEAERPESPEGLDISTRTQRTALLFGGLPYHRKHGSRMLDTILLAGKETCRSFHLGVVLDLEHPFQAALDFIAPTLVVPTDDGPPALGVTGWLARLDQKAVAISHLGFSPITGDGRGWGLIVHLLETAGQSCRGRLRLFRNPSFARQVDFQGETIIDLTIEDDAVLVDLTPHELARVVVTLG
jgi:alpha-mannosidase